MNKELTSLYAPVLHKVWRKFFDDPRAAAAPSSESYFAVVMIADISGFTQLTAWLDETIQQGQVCAGSACLWADLPGKCLCHQFSGANYSPLVLY